MKQCNICRNKDTEKCLMCFTGEEYQKLTNYDRIRNMSLEEMAVMLADEIPHGDCYGCNKCHHRDEPYRLKDGCQDGWLEWLESEVEEE